MRILCGVLAVAGALMCSGCVREQAVYDVTPASRPPAGTADSDETAAPQLIVTPDTALQGKIALVNSKLRFAVLNFSAGRIPEVDQRLVLYRRGLKVGEVKVSGPQYDDNIVADIVTGDAETGDEVRDR